MKENCPRCFGSYLKRLNDALSCLECNYENSFSDNALTIPNWVINALSFTSDELNDIREINLGMYRNGYKLVVKSNKKSSTEITPRRLSKKKTFKQSTTTSGQFGVLLKRDPNTGRFTTAMAS